MLKRGLFPGNFLLHSVFVFQEQLKIPKSECDCLYHRVISPEVLILNEHILDCTSSSGFIGNTWTALSSLGLQPGFAFPFFL